MTVNKEIYTKITKYTESIKANANKTEKEQLVSLMEKFDISSSEAYTLIEKELGDNESMDLFRASLHMEMRNPKRHLAKGVPSFRDIDEEDW